MVSELYLHAHTQDLIVDQVFEDTATGGRKAVNIHQLSYTGASGLSVVNSVSLGYRTGGDR